MLLVWGSEDRVVPPSVARALADRLPGARTLLLEGAGHPSYLDRPDDFHACLVAFLEELRTAE